MRNGLNLARDGVTEGERSAHENFDEPHDCVDRRHISGR